MITVKEKANAKINLYLDVIAKREDGFHDIKTVMHSVSFGDLVTVSVEPSEAPSVRLTTVGARFLPNDSRNLAFMAAELFLKRSEIKANVDIRLDKRIPIAAGLAGGSSDAAAVLRALNKIYGKLFSHKALNAMAAELGSDVAYCLYGKTALCEGRGELITKMRSFPEIFVVIAVANEHVSTPSAYKALDRIYSDFDGSIPTGGEERFELFMTSAKNGKLDPNGIFNIFESAVLPDCPGASAIKKRMLELGAIASMMSGSGPSVFGIFPTYDAAKIACFALRAEKYKAYYARSVTDFRQ